MYYDILNVFLFIIGSKSRTVKKKVLFLYD